MGIPLTVIGGYLGAGKTTLLNSVLHRAEGRRIGVVVNDFGPLAIDAELLADAGADGIVNLPNGCVCCTLGDDLRTTLAALGNRTPPLEHIVVEASGVADPVAVAAWGTVPPFERGGVVVLAAADSVRRQAADRYVGGEVLRQLERADLVVLTKPDVCEPAEVDSVRRWLATVTEASMATATHGNLPVALVLDPELPEPDPFSSDPDGSGSHGYVSWVDEREGVVERERLERFLGALPAGVLRLKGFVDVGEPDRHVVVQVVGPTTEVALRPGAIERSRIVAIGLAEHLDADALSSLADRHLVAS